MMKRGNDGEKIMGPMFPRLHVNDTEKGGPRAPPRNKMALYEQLSIPSQRFSHSVLLHNPSYNTASLVSPSSQGGGNDRGMFFARQLHPMHPSEMQYSQCSELSTPLAQVEQRRKVDEDDYMVPVFIQPVPAKVDKYSKSIRQQKFSLSNRPHPSLKFQKAKGTGMFEHSVGQEKGSKMGENSNESVAGQKQTVLSVSHDPGTRLRTDDSGQQELCAVSRLYSDGHSTAAMRANMAAAVKINSSDSEEASLLGEENIVHDLSDDTGSHEDESSRPPQIGSLERGDSVSESSILETESALDITPDDIVGILGKKHFWTARRAIMNQQRVFAVQLFELHRLMKVQKMIAAWPNLLVEDSGFFDKPTEPILGKKRPLDSAVNTASNASKEKGNSDNPCHKKDRSAVTSNDPNNARTPLVNHAEGRQWLIPVMSPSEGLVYKPYPEAGFPGQGCGGSCPSGPNMKTGDFLAPVFGLAAAMPQYPFPSFHQYVPHGYFPYGMPMMSPHSVAHHFSTRESMFTMPTQNNVLDRRPSEEMEVQWSSSSSPSERQPSTRKVKSSVEGAIPVLPTSSRPWVLAPRAIKVVPRNGISASESAARIFRSIQEERMQYDSV
ncbi:Protein EARLY FLOWERING [Salvia divinorum]